MGLNSEVGMQPFKNMSRGSTPTGPGETYNMMPNNTGQSTALF